MAKISKKAEKGRVIRNSPVREPGKVGAGTEQTDEHGPGAGSSIGRRSRVRPLKRLKVCAESGKLPHQSADWFAMTFFLLLHT